MPVSHRGFTSAKRLEKSRWDRLASGTREKEMFHDRQVPDLRFRLARHAYGGQGGEFAPEFGLGRGPALPGPLRTLAVHQPPHARLRNAALPKHVGDVPHEPRIV